MRARSVTPDLTIRGTASLPGSRSGPYRHLERWICLDHSKLLEQPELIHARPVLNALAAREAADINAADAHRSTSGWEAHELAAMRAPQREAANHLVTLSDGVFGHELQVWKCCPYPPIASTAAAAS